MFTNPTPENFPLDAVRAALRSKAEPLSRTAALVAHWYCGLIGETDKLRLSMWSISGLELIANDVAKRPNVHGIARALQLTSDGEDPLRLDDLAIELMWPDGGGRSPDRSARFKFLITALTLSPKTAQRDYVEFSTAWGNRADLAHGKVTKREIDRLGGAVGLFTKYARLYINSQPS